MTYHPAEVKSKPISVKTVLLRGVLILMLAGGGFAATIYRQTIWNRVTKVLAVADEDPIPVERLEKVSFQLEVPAIGEVIGLESMPLPTPNTRSGGLKIAWMMSEGSFVKPGDVVVRFDSTDAQLTLEKQQNNLESNRERTKITTGNQITNDKVLVIDKTDAEKEYEYAMTVLPQDETIFSKWDIIEAKINAGFAKEKIGVLTNKARIQKRIARSDQQILAIEKNRAQQEVDITKGVLNSLEIKSPKDGLLLYRRKFMKDPQIGDESFQGDVLVEVVDLSALQARLYVLERDSGSLDKDKAVIVRLDAIPEKEFHGTIRTVAPLAQPLELQSPLKYFNCDVVILDAMQDFKRIKPGMSLKAQVILEKYESCFVVPSSSITTKGTVNTVYVREGNRFTPRTVKIGAGVHGQAILLSGVKENEWVAMRNPFETRKAYLPDFSKASGGGGGPGGPGGGMRIMFRDH